MENVTIIGAKKLSDLPKKNWTKWRIIGRVDGEFTSIETAMYTDSEGDIYPKGLISEIGFISDNQIALYSKLAE